MTNTSPQLRALIDRFVADLEAVVRAEVLYTLEQALAGSAEGTSRLPARTPAPAVRVRPSQGTPKKALSRNAPTSKKRVRRTVAEIEQTSRRIRDHIKQNPGRGAEVIKATLGVSEREWVASIARLLEKGEVTAKGEKRSRTYSAS